MISQFTNIANAFTDRNHNQVYLLLLMGQHSHNRMLSCNLGILEYVRNSLKPVHDDYYN